MSKCSGFLGLLCMLLAFQVKAQKDTSKHGVLLFIGDSVGNLRGVAVPLQKGVVNDFENVFTHAQAAQIAKLVTDVKALDSNQVVVITVPDYYPYSTIDSIANSFAGAWEVGTKHKNGVILIFSIALKQARIQVGEGLNNKLIEQTCQYIIQSRLIPEFINKNYFKGTMDATQEILSIIKPVKK